MNLAHLWHFSVVRLLVRKHPPAITDEDVNGNTPLHLAALHGRTGVVDFLISEEANVNERYVMHVYAWIS